MLADQLCLPTLSAFNPTFLDRSKATATCCSVSIQVQLYCSTAVKRCRNPQSLFLSSKSSRRSFAVRSSTHADHHDDDFLPASLLVTGDTNSFLLLILIINELNDLNDYEFLNLLILKFHWMMHD